MQPPSPTPSSGRSSRRKRGRRKGQGGADSAHLLAEEEDERREPTPRGADPYSKEAPGRVSGTGMQLKRGNDPVPSERGQGGNKSPGFAAETQLRRGPGEASEEAADGGSDAAHYLNQEVFRRKASGFYLYDPTLWLPTLSFHVTPFMAWPWFLITSAVTAVTVFILYVHPEFRDEVSFSTDVHVLLGGALSFIVVFRTNASCKSRPRLRP